MKTAVLNLLVIVIVLAAILTCAGCGTTATERVNRYFGSSIGGDFNYVASIEAAQRDLREAILRVLPVGSSRPQVEARVSPIVQRDRYAKWYAEPDKSDASRTNLLLIVDYDVRTFQWSKESYLIDFYFDHLDALTNVRVRVVITGP